MHAGRSEQLKAKLAVEVTRAVTSTLNLGEDSVSVALEDIAPSDWTQQVYKPDIVGKPKTIYKKPGYNPL
jgi:4-oxalocrotonate tautomerase